MQQFTQQQLNTLNHESITKCAKNVHQSVADKNRESDATNCMVAAKTEWCSFLNCMQLTVCVSVARRHNVSSI